MRGLSPDVGAVSAEMGEGRGGEGVWACKHRPLPSSPAKKIWLNNAFAIGYLRSAKVHLSHGELEKAMVNLVRGLEAVGGDDDSLC